MKKSSPQLSIPQLEVISSQKPRTLFLAGQGSGKTFVMGVLSGLFLRYLPGALGFIGANTYNQLSNSTLLRVFQVWADDYGWTEWTRTNEEGCFVIGKQPPGHFIDHNYTFKDNYNKIFFANGAVILVGSLDNYKALDGSELGWAMLDETKDTKEEAVQDVMVGRLRQRGVYLNTNPESGEWAYTSDSSRGKQQNPLYIFTSPTKEQWLTEYFVLNDQRDAITATIFKPDGFYSREIGHRHVVICPTYHNSHNLPPGYIEDRLKEYTKDRTDMLIYGSPFGKAGNEYYANFKRNDHVGEVIVDDGLPIHLTFDFNVNPYMTGQVWQIDRSGQVEEVRCVKEYAFENPRNTVEDICRAAAADFGDIMQRQGLYFYGDSTGRATLPLKGAKNYYEFVERELRAYLYNDSRRLLKQNPRHAAIGQDSPGRRDFMNSILGGSYDVRLVIDASCEKTILDFEMLKEDKNGAKHKEKVKINGISCEKYGHMTDAADAFICYNYGQWRKERRA
jgi:hypothetical protein